MNMPNFPFRRNKLSVAVIMTGGTIAKSYNPTSAKLYNYELKAQEAIEGLRNDDLEFTFIDLMHKDSLDIDDEDRLEIVAKIEEVAPKYDAILVTHGTDALAETGYAVFEKIGAPNIPIVFTGAMVPLALAGSDGLQNLTESLLALRLLPAGLFIVFHNRVLTIPGVKKNYDSLTFEES